MTGNSLDNIRPGDKKQRRGRTYPRGRQLDPTALTDIQKLLTDKPRQPDLLIEYLHLIQDKWGYISSSHLMALASELKLSQAAVYEVATFYHHFDVIKENEVPPPEITIRVCQSLSCSLNGSSGLLKELIDQSPDNTRIVSAPCMGLCNQAPAAAINKHYLGNVSTDSLIKATKSCQKTPSYPAIRTISNT